MPVPRHLHHAASGTANERFAHGRDTPGIGSDGNDLAAALGAHDTRRGLNGKSPCEPMRADVGFEVGAVHLHEQAKRQRIAARSGAAGHQYVKPPMALRNARDHRLHGEPVGQVRGLELGLSAGRENFVDNGLTRCGVASIDDHKGTALREFDGNGAADIGCGARHQGDLVSKRIRRFQWLDLTSVW